jgi:zinc transport system ATP-binding protein
MVGLIKPLQGSAVINSSQAHPCIGYLPQKVSSFNQAFPATVTEVISMSVKDTGPREHKNQRIKQMLDKVGLWEKRDSLLGALSGGQLQRVFIARALMNNPEILFLDEPANNLDIKSQEELYYLLHSLHQEGLTIIMVSHDVNPLLDYNPRLLYVNKGEISEMLKENLKAV